MNQIIETTFLENIGSIMEEAREKAKTAVNLSMVYAYFEIGRQIFEQEQQGRNRAGYGTQLLKELSAYLTDRFGKGFSADNLKLMRRFYVVYRCDSIGETVFPQLYGSEKGETVFPKSQGNEETEGSLSKRPFFLSWSHYLVLMRIESEEERHFYEIEAVKNNWSLSELRRQKDSALYERLLLSADKDRVHSLSKNGQIIERPSDVIKDPYVLEFLGLHEKPYYSESDLEHRIIDHMQEFLMEMGKGFSFVGRQVRFTFEEEHFRVDLVLYNRLLRCFVLVDLKTGKLKHQDLGQMQMYVNYYDRYEKTDDEAPTVGILLCSEKNDNMVELTLPENSNIYASQYELYLPDKELLQKKLEQWIEEEGRILE